MKILLAWMLSASTLCASNLYAHNDEHKATNLALLNDKASSSSSKAKSDTSSKSWYTHKKIDNDIWLINDNGQDNIYLVEGEETALVIDTGLGYQNLKSYVSTLTEKPLVIVNSHAHPDHAGGNHDFGHVHIHKNELETLQYYTSEPVMADTFKRFVKSPMPEHLLDENKPSASMITIDEGFEFDLGDRTIHVIHIPGHSTGSIALFDNKSRNMFTGDMTTEHIWLQVKHATTVEDYLSSIRKLKKYKETIRWLLPGHGAPLKPEHLDTLEAAAEKLLSGTCDVTPYTSPLGEHISCHHENVIIVHKSNFDSETEGANK